MTAKAALDTKFMIAPQIPVVLTVTISSRATMNDITAPAAGPSSIAAAAIIASLTSNVRNPPIPDIFSTNITTYAMAQNIAVSVRSLILSLYFRFVMFSSFPEGKKKALLPKRAQSIAFFFHPANTP